VTAAELLSVAAFHEGKHAQAFPSFGSERMGAPVMSFCRVDDRPVRLREPIVEPDAIVIQDATLLHAVPVFEGLDVAGFVLLNTRKPRDTLGCNDLVAKLPAGHFRVVAANDIAEKHLGRPLANAALLGGLLALTELVSMGSLSVAIRARFAGKVGDQNVAAAAEAYAHVRESTAC